MICKLAVIHFFQLIFLSIDLTVVLLLFEDNLISFILAISGHFFFF